MLATMMEARIQMGHEEALKNLDSLTMQCIGLLMAATDTSGSGFTTLLCALSQVGGAVFIRTQARLHACVHAHVYARVHAHA